MSGNLIRRFGTLVCVSLIGAAMASPSAHAQSTVRVIRELKHDVSRPLAELGKMTPAQPNRFSPRLLKVLPTKPLLPAEPYAVADAALQEQALPPVSATVG